MSVSSAIQTVHDGPKSTLKAAQDQHVTYRGMTLSWQPSSQSPQSMLQAASEEMSFLAAQRKTEKHIKTRNFNPKVSQAPSIQEQMDAVKEEAGFGQQKKADKKLILKKDKVVRKKTESESQYEILKRKVPDLDKEMLKDFGEKLITEPPDNLENLDKFITTTFSDVSHRYVAIIYLKEFLSKKIKEFSTCRVSGLATQAQALAKILSWLNVVLVELGEQYEAEIKAGLNISDVLVYFVKQKLLDSMQGLRNFYREAVLGYDRKMVNIYRKIVKKYGIKNFQQTLKFLSKSVSCDMNAHGPSVEKSKLQQLMDDTFILSFMANTYEQLFKLLARVKKPRKRTRLRRRRESNEGEEEDYDSDIDLIMISILEIKDQAFFSKRPNSNLIRLVRKLGFRDRDVAKKINFMAGLKEIMRHIPLKFFAEDSKRHDMLRMFQVTLDTFVEQEEPVNVKSQ